MWSSIFSLKERSKAVRPDPEGAGIRVSYWFWGAAQRIAHAADKKQLSEPNAKPIPYNKWSDCSHDVAAKGKVSNPYAVCNWSLGRKYKEKLKAIQAKREADSETTTPAVTLPAGKKPIRKKESSKITITSQISSHRFLESTAGAGGEYPVALITEGLGNMHDAFYYTKDALQSAVAIFEGLKSYADHPTLVEEDIRPERSTRDIIGHFEDLSIAENDQGCAELRADICVLSDKDWVTALIERAIENAEKFPGKPFVGLSINANGQAEPTPIDDVIKTAPPGAIPKLKEAKEQGIETVRVVTKFDSAVSCDLVTEAGAGGKFLIAS